MNSNNQVEIKINDNDVIEQQFPPRKNGYTVKEYMWADLKLDTNEMLIYSIISAYGYYICNIMREGNNNYTPSSLNTVTGLSSKTLRRTLAILVSDGIISVAQIKITESLKRNIYVANYNESGRLSREKIKQLLNAGITECIQYYALTENENCIRGKKARK